MYESFFMLSGKPFQLNPDAGFYFASKGHNRAYAYLKYGVYQAEGFIVLTGEIGAGKTTMAQALLADIDTSQIVAAQLSSTQLEADDLVHAVAGAFGMPIKPLSKAEILDHFEAHLRSLTASGRRALLIVDEAQNLTPGAMEELRMLSNFQLGTRAMLQSFLVGQPELREILRAASMKQLRQRVIATYHLGPMQKEETEAYVLHRMTHVGWKGDPTFEPAVFDRLHKVTGGLPRMINVVCDRLLLGAFMDQKHVIGLAEIDETIKEMRAELGDDALEPEVSNKARNGQVPVAPVAAAALGARLERIERNVSTAVGLLQRISGVEAPTASGAAADRRPRFGSRQSRP